MSSSPYTFKSTGTTTRPSRMKPPPEPPLPSPPHTRSRSSSISSTTSFASAVSTHNHNHNDTTDPDHEPQPPILPRFSPAEEASMLSASNTLKLAANKQFAARDYSSAISTYDKAIAELPIYLDYELAVLQSNISACHLAMGEWKEAVDSAEKGLDCLEREFPMDKPKEKERDKNTDGNGNVKNENSQDAMHDDGQIVELPDDTTEEKAAEMLKRLDISDQRKTDITRIRSKLLLRRARSKVMICDQPKSSKPNATTALNTDTDDPNPRKQSSPFSSKSTDPPSHWSNLSTALLDYTTLSTPAYFSILPTSDRKTVLDMLRTLPPRVEAAKKKEVDEMMGKLKELGNGILKPFGLSTDMFKMTQDPATGGWSMGFDGKGGKG